MSLLEQIQNKQHNLKTTPNEKKDFTKLHQPVVFTHFFELTTYFILNLSYLFSMKMFCITEADYERLMNETFFERYFEEIRPFTFKSSFIPLSKEDAHLINLLQQEYEQHGEKVFQQLFENKSIQKLCDEIEKQKQTLGNTLFVRLSSRSPKDAVLSDSNFLSHFTKTLRSLEEIDTQLGITNNTDQNRRVHALYIVSTEALSVTSGKEAISLLIRSNRIQGDLRSYAQSTTTTTQKEQLNIILREFVSFLVELEFRAFIYQRKLTALTQYNEFCYFPRLVLHKQMILNTITKFIENELIKRISLNNYVVDVVLISQNKTDPFDDLKVFVIEINPFAEFAGAGLFAWTEDRDILVGRRPFEFRIAVTPPKFALQQMSKEWVPFVFPEKNKK